MTTALVIGRMAAEGGDETRFRNGNKISECNV